MPNKRSIPIMTPKLKLNRKAIDIVVTDYLGSKRSTTVNAWVFNDTLAAHKNVYKTWTLTHVSTGLKLTTFSGKYNSLRPMLKELLDSIDFTEFNGPVRENDVNAKEAWLAWFEMLAIINKYEKVENEGK